MWHKKSAKLSKGGKLLVKSGHAFSSFPVIFSDRFIRFFVSLVIYFRENIQPVTWFEIYLKFLNSFLSFEDMFYVCFQRKFFRKCKKSRGRLKLTYKTASGIKTDLQNCHPRAAILTSLFIG